VPSEDWHWEWWGWTNAFTSDAPDNWADQFIDVYDDFAGEVPADQHVLADAVRLTPFVAPVPDAAPPVVTPPADAGPGPEVDAATGPGTDDAGGVSETDAGPKPGLGDAGGGPADEPDASADDEGGGTGGAGGSTIPTGVRAAFGPTPRKVSYQGSAGCSTAPGRAGGGLAGLIVVLGLAGSRSRRRRNA
jgi:MYXO-CTERM domain-containing protein